MSNSSSSTTTKAIGGRRSRRSTSTTPSGGGTTKRSKSKNSTAGNKNCIDLTAFGFSRRKKRASADTTASTITGNNPVIELGDSSSSSPDIEIIASPTKRARRTIISAPGSKSVAKKIGAGKENGTSSKYSSSTIMHDTSMTPAKKSSGDGNIKRRASAASAATINLANSSGESSSRVALLDLTRDSSSESLDRQNGQSSLNTSGLPIITAATTIKTTTTTIITTAVTAKSANSLSGMADSIVGKILAGGQQQQEKQQRRGKREKPHQSNIRHGLKRAGSIEAPISIFEDEPAVTKAASRKSPPVKARPSRAKNPPKAKSPPKVVRSLRRTKSPPKAKSVGQKKKASSPQPLARGGSIQSYFSAATAGSPKINASPTGKGSPTVKGSPKGRPTPTVRANSPKKASPPRTTSNNIRANALGLVRVANHHAIACTTAVAQARKLFFNPNDNTIVGAATAAEQPKRIFPGAILGRATSKTKPNFVDLGIAITAAGISRNHVKILSVNGLDTVGQRQQQFHRQSQQMSQLSQTSTATSTSISGKTAPSLLLQVHETSTNGVQVHRTSHGERGSMYLGQGKQKSLRIGDAIEFFSTDKIYFCVVGLFSDQGEVAGGQRDVGGVGGSERGVGGEWGASEGGNAVRTLDFTPPPGRKKAPPLLRGTGNVTARKKKKRPVVKDVEALLVYQDDVKAKSDRKAKMETIEIDDSDDQKMRATEKVSFKQQPRQPLTAENSQELSPTKKSQDEPKTSSQETIAAAAATAKIMAIPGNTPSPFAKEESAPPPPLPDESMDVTMELVEGSQDLCDAAVVTMDIADDESEDNKCEAVKMQVADESLVQEKQCESMAVENERKLPAVAKKEPQCEDNNEAPVKQDVVAPIKKGDEVKVLYEVYDMFTASQKQWIFGTVMRVTSAAAGNIRVKFDEVTSVNCALNDLEKLEISMKDSPEQYYPETFRVGDIVDAKFKDGPKWYRGRVANVSENGNACDIMYNDGDYESNIPTKEKKIRLSQRCDSSGEWLMGKSVMLKADGNCFRTGTVSKQSGDSNYQVTFSDGSSESVRYEEVVKAAFANLITEQHIWPVAMTISMAPLPMTSSMAETVRLRRQRKEEKKAMDESSGQEKKPAVKSETQGKPGEAKAEQKPVAINSGRTRSSSRTACSNNLVKAEPVDATDEIETPWLNEHDNAECLDLQGLNLHRPAVALSVLEKRKTAKDFPPGLPNVLWCALNSPEAQTGANFLRDLLCVHDAVPPSTMVQKLMDLMKYGPKAEGSSVHFKDPHRTELAAEYVCGLVAASSRLVQKDSYPLFGPSSWDDIEVLLSQSIVETENMISGRRLAQGLQLAARGAKLLSLMLTTELQGNNLYATSSVTFDSTSLKTMPTVRLVKSYGVRSGLNAAVRHTTKCLVRHSRWVMDQGDLESSSGSSVSISDECCALEARVCLDSLGSAICLIAWLFCVEERVPIVDPSVAFVIKDAFLVELERCLEDVPEMNERNKKKFVKKLKMYFLLSLSEEFCTPMVVTLGKMIGVEDELALVGLVA